MIYAILDGKYKIDGFDPVQVLSITFAEAEFRNIVTRGGTLSNQVKLAKTGNNQRTLGLLDEVKARTLQAYKLFEADLYIDNLKVFSGNMTILESNDYITVRFFSSSAGFFSSIKGRKLNTIDLSAFNHTWTAANVNSRRQATTGVVYPNINYGSFTSIAVADQAHTRFFPAVYINTLFDEIATELGYTYTALNNFTTVLPFSLDQFRNPNLNGRSTKTADQTILIANTNVQAIDFDLIDSDPFNLYTVGTVNGTTISNGKGSSIFSGVLNYAANAANGAAMTINFYVAGVVIQTIIAVNPGETGSLNWEFTLDFTNFAAYPVPVYIGVIGGNGDEIDILEDSTFNLVEGAGLLTDGSVILIQDTLPDLSITELFKYVAIKENAIISVDNQSKTIKFERFDEIVNRYPTANDFSKKVADENNVRTIFHLDEYAQENHLDYKVPSEDDPTSIPTVQGRGTFTIADNSLENEKVLYEAPFFRSGLFTGIQTKPVMIIIPRYSTTALAYDDPNLSPGIRVLDISINSDILINISAVSTVTPQANVTFSDFAKDVTDHYGTFTTALNNLKVIEVDLNVTAQDISEVSFNRPIFLLDSYWYVIKIKQFEVNRASPTTFRLLRLF